MRRLLSKAWFQCLVAPALLTLGYWLGSYLWGRVDNAPDERRLDKLENQQSATDAAATDLKDDVHHMRGRIDAIYDYLLRPSDQKK